jgi:hypothetical protein
LINPEHDPDIKGRVERLMGFLRKLAMKRSAPARHVDQHHKTLWLSELSSRTVLDEAAEAGGEFLSVPRVQLAPEPELPHELWSWVDKSGKEPALRDRGSLPGSADVVHRSEAPDAVKAFERWLPIWRRWADQEAERLAIRQLHDTLSDMDRHLVVLC